MTDLDSLLRAYVEEHQAGGDADPGAYLDRVEGADRVALRALIEAYLERAPRRGWDRSAFAGSAAERVVDEVEASLQSPAGLWPRVLPWLRQRAQITRSELVSRLARSLGHPDQADKVAVYYHRMEQGTLPAAGVSDRVLEALGSIYGESLDSLRRLGQAFVAEHPGQAQPGEQFARLARIEPEYQEQPPAAAPPAPEEAAGQPLQPDEIDRLFAGG